MLKLFYLIGLNISIGLFLSSAKGNESDFYSINLSDKSPGNTSPVRNQGGSEWCAAFSFTQIQQDCVKNELYKRLENDKCNSDEKNEILNSIIFSPWYLYGVLNIQNGSSNQRPFEKATIGDFINIFTPEKESFCQCSNAVVNRAFKAYTIQYLQNKNSNNNLLNELIRTDKDLLNELIRTDKGMRNLYNNSDLYSFYSKAKRFNGNEDELFFFCKEYFGKCELEEIEKQFCQLFSILSDLNNFDPRKEIKKQCDDEGKFCSCDNSDSTSMISEKCLKDVKICIPDACEKLEEIKPIYGQMEEKDQNLLTSHDTEFRKNILEDRIKEIKNELEKGNSLSIDFCTAAITKEPESGIKVCSTNQNNHAINHYAIITGFRNFSIDSEGNKLVGPQVLIKNSWGASCNGYSSTITENSCWSSNGCLHPNCNGVTSTICQGACYKGEMWVNAEEILVGRIIDSTIPYTEIAKIYKFTRNVK